MSQEKRLLSLLSDGRPHRTDEIIELVYGNKHAGLARAGARIFGLKKKGHLIDGWRDPERPALYWYKMTIGRKLNSLTRHPDAELFKTSRSQHGDESYEVLSV